jgi:putative nucleotidyltransferase with HDIG domain
MIIMRILYRVRQFWQVLTADSNSQNLDQARQVLSSGQMDLFMRLQPGERAHSLQILQQLCVQGEENSDLLIAALLHDIGKSVHPLRLRERVVIVIAKTLFPNRIRAWGQGEPERWRRPFVIAEQHGTWGAEMAAQAGVSALTASIIRRHHDLFEPNGSREVLNHPLSDEEQLILKLQALDNHY